MSKLFRNLCLFFVTGGMLSASGPNSGDNTNKLKMQNENKVSLVHPINNYLQTPLDKNNPYINTIAEKSTAIDTLLEATRIKLANLERAVAEIKSKGIDTRYEEVTINTARLFLDTSIPWDIANPGLLANAYRRSRSHLLKGTPEEEAARTPLWELEQTREIIDGAMARLSEICQRCDTRRPVPAHNVDNLTVEDGFLSADGLPAFSGGFIWAPPARDTAYFGLKGGEVWTPFSDLQSDGNYDGWRINSIINSLDNLQAIGQKGSIVFGHNVPSWAVEQWPDINDYTTHHFNYDIDHPQVKELWSDLIASLVPKIRNHPANFDCQLAIEPQWPSVGTWQVNNASPHTFRRYQEWLEDLYGSIRELNSSWGTDHGSFSEINSRPADSSNPAIWYDWCRFNQFRVTDFFAFLRDEIQKHHPDAKCHIRISVGGIHARSGRNNHTLLHRGIDRETLIDMMEINGLVNFMEETGTRNTHHLYDEDAYALNWLGFIMLYDFIRSLAPDKLIYDSEHHSVTSTYYQNPELPPGYMTTAMWSATLHGLGSNRTWFWSRNTNGSPGRYQTEFYGSILLQPRVLNEYGRVFAKLNAFGKELVALERTGRQIYLLYSESSAIQSVDYLNNQMIAYEALQFTGLRTGFVTERTLQDTGLPEDGRLLVIADASHVNETMVEWLRNYVQDDGRLLVIGNNALKYNEYGVARDPSEIEFLSGTYKLDVIAPP